MPRLCCLYRATVYCLLPLFLNHQLTTCICSSRIAELRRRLAAASTLPAAYAAVVAGSVSDSAAAITALEGSVAREKAQQETVRKRLENERMERIRSADARKATPPRRRTPRKGTSPSAERPGT